MSAFDDFVHISTGPIRAPPPHPHLRRPTDSEFVTKDFFDNGQGLTHSVETLMVQSIRNHHPNHHITITQGADFIGFAAAHEDITCELSTAANQAIIETYFAPPARRFGEGAEGAFVSQVNYGCYDYHFKGTDFIMYFLTGSNGSWLVPYRFILTPTGSAPTDVEIASAQQKADDLLSAQVKFAEELHGEVLVFDQGWWQKSKELYQNIQKSNWEDVILAKERKKAIINDVVGFFNSADRYAEFGVPWKRGVIFYGPPGNGKTISTKALMHDLSKRTSPAVNTLYVKTLSSYQGPEYSIRQIFEMARHMAPCLLIFEDIDSLISPGVRSYFLNEVDGLESNHGILMIGSTNHLDRLDPGIAKRPSRFDRKYFFDDPDLGERVQYAEYWRYKLRDNKKVVFPKVLCEKVAGITDGFSFAYMKEAFVAALLVIAGNGVETERKVRGYGGDELEGNVFWKELQVQVDNLKKEMDDEGEESVVDGGMLKGLNLGAAVAPPLANLPMPHGLRMPGGEFGARGRPEFGPGMVKGREQLQRQRQYEMNNVMPGFSHYGN